MLSCYSNPFSLKISPMNPQGLKPVPHTVQSGTAKAVPSQKEAGPPKTIYERPCSDPGSFANNQRRTRNNWLATTHDRFAGGRRPRTDGPRLFCND